MSTFAATANKDFFPNPKDNVMDSLFKQYERVIIESIITSFGLDMFIKDQHGGDVDTIHNVRKVGTDSDMTYKNVQNYKNYENRGVYDYNSYHDGNSNYQAMKRDAKKDFQATGRPIEDAYTGKDLYFYSKGAAKGNADKQASIDHVLTTHTMHNDPGRVLSGLKGEDLANSKENLVFTNSGLNSSMGATKENNEVVEIPDYLAKHPELPDETKERMMNEYKRAKKAYETKLAYAYYTSPAFLKDTAKATGKTAAQMGIRQVCGLIFTEIWFSVREEFNKIGKPFDLCKLFTSIGNGIKQGFEKAKAKYKELIDKFISGATAGALSSLTTTLCNIFFTTAKNTVKIIRQSYASLIEAGKILLLNPNNYPFGERMRAVAKIISTGASVVVGTVVNESVEKVVGKLPVIGGIIPVFCGSLVTGIMTCSLLYFLDRSEIINRLVSILDKIPSISNEVNYFARQAELFEAYAAELMEIDLEKFKKEVNYYNCLTANINENMTDNELNTELKKILDVIGVKIPWEGSFYEFMGNKNNRLVFG